LTNLLLLISMLAAFSALEVGLLAGAAMLVGARQQQRTLATIAATGAPRRTLIAMISMRGLVLGLGGGVLGSALGVAAAGAYLLATSDGSATRYPGFHLPWPLLAGTLAFALVVGWVSALIPAVNASRFDVVAALRGSRAPRTVNRHGVVAGLVMLTCGAALTLLAGAGLVLNGRLEAEPHPTAVARFVPIGVETLFIVGPVVMIIGVILALPLLLRALGRLFARAGRSSVLASRDAARNRGRSVPAIATTLTAVFLAAFAMTTSAGSDAGTRDGYVYQTMPREVDVVPSQLLSAQQRADQASVATSLRQTMPVTDVTIVREPRSLNTLQYNGTADPPPVSETAMNVSVAIPPAKLCPVGGSSRIPGSSSITADRRVYAPLAADERCRDLGVMPNEVRGGASSHVVVGDVSVLRVILGAKPSAAAVAALASGKAVSLHPLLVQGGMLELDFRTDKQIVAAEKAAHPAAPKRTATLAAVVEQPAEPLARFAAVISPETAMRLGIDVVDGEVLAQLSRMPTDAETDALNLAVGPHEAVLIENGPSDSGQLIRWVALGASSLIALASAIVALGLARIDGRQDDSTLMAIGASQRTRRGVAFWQAVILTGTGALLGVVTGVVTAFAFALPGTGTEFVLPWLQLGIAAIGLPLTIAVVMVLLVRAPRAQLNRRTAIA
jgi:putative ABC transport system permease protein